MEVALVPRFGPAVAHYPPGSTFGPRYATSFEFVWILHGGASWSGAGATAELDPGSLLLVRPGMRDSFRWSPRRSTRHAYVHFTLSGHGGLPPYRQWPLTRTFGGRDDLVTVLCRHLLQLSERRPAAWLCQVRDAIRLLVFAFVGREPERYGAGSLPEPVETMLAYIRERWSDGIARPVPLPDLAAAAAISPTSLCRIFRHRFGMGPVGALELIRLARAEPLLWMSNLTLSAIATQCGFADAYHFSRRFRAAYGVAPSGFRASEPAQAPPSPATEAGLLVLAHHLAPPSSAAAY